MREFIHMRPVFVLVHSLLLGPSTWRPVAARLTAERYQVLVPSLLDVPPYWPAVADAIHNDARPVPPDTPVVLVAHSNAGLFLPVIGARLDRPVIASVFVDAALPATSGWTPATSPENLSEFLRPMATDGVLPRWTDWWDAESVASLFPDSRTRETVISEQRTLPLSYYEQRIPVPDGWDDHPCAYLRFSPSYADRAAQARERGWRVAHLPGDHLHQLVDPDGTARQLIELAS
jgi:hypothetical protein